MLQPTDISATFHPSTIPNSKSLGVGQLNVCGIIISFTAYPSTYGSGIIISYPSKPVIKNGVHEKDQYGKGKYYNEVYIADQNVRGLAENAVLTAMANKGVYPPQGQQSQYNTQNYSNNISQQQYINGQGIVNNRSNSISNDSFVNPHSTSYVPPTVSNPGASIVSGDELPF